MCSIDKTKRCPFYRGKIRDPKRISKLLELIRQAWEKDPDLRFNQLIYNLQGGYSHVNNGEGKVEEVVDERYSRVGFDLFNLEDEKFIQYLNKYLDDED